MHAIVAERGEHVVADHLASALERHTRLPAGESLDALDTRPQLDLNPVLAQDVGDRGRDILVLTGELARFVVQKRASVSKAAFPTQRVYRNPGYPALRLITCDGDFDESRRSYTRNLVIFAKLEKHPVGKLVDQVAGLPVSGS